LIVVADAEVPEDGGLVEVAERRHVVDPVDPEVLTSFDLKCSKLRHFKNISFNNRFIFK
jgi:hypothetical protein